MQNPSTNFTHFTSFNFYNTYIFYIHIYIYAYVYILYEHVLKTSHLNIPARENALSHSTCASAFLKDINLRCDLILMHQQVALHRPFQRCRSTKAEKNKQMNFYQKKWRKLQQNYANLCAHPVKGSNNINNSNNAKERENKIFTIKTRQQKYGNIICNGSKASRRHLLLLHVVALATMMTMAFTMTLTIVTLQRHWQRNCNVAALYVVVIAYLPRKLHLIELFAAHFYPYLYIYTFINI